MDTTQNKESLLTNKTFLSFYGAFFVLLFITMLFVINIATQVDDIEEQLQHVSPQTLEASPSTEAVAASQTVYVPVYSHIYAQGGKPYLLESTLSIRNTDTTHAITLNALNYFNTAGKLVKSYLNKRVSLAPLATTEILVEQQKTEGGSGANFLVDWSSSQEVNPPLIEAVMIGIDGQTSISFVSTGVTVSGY